ncbi:dCTP deaminase [Methanosphaera cuniculi]|uniref:dCTP deaminase, dUMP-forming n=1 Tax=Methanosphaera cuniculi TaxID=1077256 RepID=A0A2A2HF44_9EURY|nr:dCTP deaminase [Methanosphaera cuniculi]PAV08091.1 hypothetical protein ASJ82_01100 [Methanosphaera cuniculi]PWL07726.1 deoxycytidine triphosphate deaminase [Methanosphaera cuniculi]
MTVCSDKTLKRLIQTEQLVIRPCPEDEQYQPASIDLRLANDWVKLKKGSKISHVRYGSSEYIIQPDEFLLARTLEHVEIPPHMVGRVEGRSSYGRLGLMIHITAGFIDPGFKGTITLELKNISSKPIILHEGDCICQLVMEYLDCPCEVPYNGHYQNQELCGRSVLSDKFVNE